MYIHVYKHIGICVHRALNESTIFKQMDAWTSCLYTVYFYMQSVYVNNVPCKLKVTINKWTEYRGRWWEMDSQSDRDMMRIRSLRFYFSGFRVAATWRPHAALGPKASTSSAALQPGRQLIAHLRETLKPNTLSNSFMSFLSRVLLPAPDGPVSTTGLGPAMAEGDTEREREEAQWGRARGRVPRRQTQWNPGAWVMRSGFPNHCGVASEVFCLKNYPISLHWCGKTYNIQLLSGKWARFPQFLSTHQLCVHLNKLRIPDWAEINTLKWIKITNKNNEYLCLYNKKKYIQV